MGPDWTLLPENAVNIISEKACSTNLQYVNLRTVCKDWWTALAPYPRHLRQSMWLLLPRLSTDVCRRIRFSNSKLSFYDVFTSQTHDFELSYISGKYICGSSFGWLALEHDHKLSFFNPITGSSMNLPSFYPMLKVATSRGMVYFQSKRQEQYTHCVYKVILSCSPSKRDCFVVAQFLWNSSDWELVFCRMGDTCWTGLKRWDSGPSVLDFICHNNMVYTVNRSYKMSVYGLQDVSVCKFSSKLKFVRYYEKIYLVEGGAVSDGPLVIKFTGRFPGETLRVVVYKWFNDKQEWCQVHNIGKRVIFVSSGVLGLNLHCINLQSEKELERRWQENEDESLENEMYYVGKHNLCIGGGSYSVSINRVNLERGTSVPHTDHMSIFSSHSEPAIWFTPSPI